MSRGTIDFGIDLGTTNSSIAMLKGSDTEIVKNNENLEITPSAVWIDKKGSLFVGRHAKDRLIVDSENASSEFKLLMGTNTEISFKRSGRRMTPEELSAEVLKSLKADVTQRIGEEIEAAVITVPAAFDLLQCKATEAAARLAGLKFSPLLQEPAAAAMAYGFQHEGNKSFWLVYDFGGGAFDAAVAQVRNGMIQIVNHGGDNQLGGKLIDWRIIEDLFLPALEREYDLPDFNRGNKKWLAAFAKLKKAAEEAKIVISRDNSAEIFIESLCLDATGEQVQFEYELSRADVARLAEPFIRRSVNICKKVLSDSRLGAQGIEKALMVGEAVLTPYLKEMLEDKRAGLGIPLDFSVDPNTVVSRGAAIFAGAQQIRRTEIRGINSIEIRREALSKLSLHPSVLLAWNMANNEACLSGFKRIEPVHFWYAILKILDDAYIQEAERFDFTEKEIQAITEILDEARAVAGLSDDDITVTRRQLRKELRAGGKAGNIRTLHRSESSRAIFRRAVIRAHDDEAEELSLEHLIEEIVAEHRRDRGDIDAFECASDLIQ